MTQQLNPAQKQAGKGATVKNFMGSAAGAAIPFIKSAFLWALITIVVFITAAVLMYKQVVFANTLNAAQAAIYKIVIFFAYSFAALVFYGYMMFFSSIKILTERFEPLIKEIMERVSASIKEKVTNVKGKVTNHEITIAAKESFDEITQSIKKHIPQNTLSKLVILPIIGVVFLLRKISMWKIRSVTSAEALLKLLSAKLSLAVLVLMNLHNLTKIAICLGCAGALGALFLPALIYLIR